MKDVQDMTDEEYRLYQARGWAARRYRAEGFEEYAERVERGLEDGCSQVRLGRFFIDPAVPPTVEYIAAWNQLAAAEASAE